MWVLVFFDLPTVRDKDKKRASQFRRFLLNEGYLMVQWSVYARPCNGDERVKKHIRHLKANLPPAGSIRLLKVTDRQWDQMDTLVGSVRKEEQYACEQLVLL